LIINPYTTLRPFPQASSVPYLLAMESTLDHLVRNLAGEYADIDYSILSVVVLTLGLILVVEICRHQLDEVAKTRTFLHAVLGSVYQECKSARLLVASSSRVLVATRLTPHCCLPFRYVVPPLFI
jgi:hypothetical protein